MLGETSQPTQVVREPMRLTRHESAHTATLTPLTALVVQPLGEDGQVGETDASTGTLPCVVHVGFVGSRELFDLPQGDAALPLLRNAAEQYLIARLQTLRTDLKLQRHHFLCGISQVAIGADSLFARACQKLQIPHRIFLPQHYDAYLEALGPTGEPDFTPEERAVAEILLKSDHVIEDRLVTDAPDRATRFEDTNIELLRASDVIVCLSRAAAGARLGGTARLLELARKDGKTALEITVAVQNGQAIFREEWSNSKEFKLPQLPPPLANLPWPPVHGQPLPSVSDYCAVIKRFASQEASRQRSDFTAAARVIIGAHILATICAALAMALHADHGPEPAPTAQTESFFSYFTLGLLLLEVIVLARGYWTHRRLHRSESAGSWASARLVAEITRSVQSLGTFHLHLRYLFHLQPDKRLLPLLHTLDVLHLRSTRSQGHDDWKRNRDGYVAQRLEAENSGQIGYYRRELANDTRRLRLANVVFAVSSLSAVGAATLKLVVTSGYPTLSAPWQSLAHGGLGTLAIVLPVLAVAGVSWAAAMGYEARVQTFRDTLQFLDVQKTRLQQAASARELEKLVVETESGLLAETANWFSRRAFTSQVA